MSITDAYAVKTIELYAKDGKLHDSFTIAQGKEWPDLSLGACTRRAKSLCVIARAIEKPLV
jgi:hypothetical protein